MKPKEKANELYEKYFHSIPSFNDEGEIEHNTAKQCALIAVDEIMYNCYEVMEPFWQEVKQEINKL